MDDFLGQGLTRESQSAKAFSLLRKGSRKKGREDSQQKLSIRQSSNFVLSRVAGVIRRRERGDITYKKEVGLKQRKNKFSE